MSDPAEEATAPPSPASDGDAKPARGPAPAKLDSRQRDELLGLVAGGKGLDQALRQLGVPYRAYLNSIRADPEFRQEVASARRSADQALREVGYLTAQTGESPEFLFKMIERRDKFQVLDQARKDRMRERAEDLEQRRLDRALRLHLAEMQAAAREKERAEKAGGAGDSKAPDFSRLDDADIAEMRRILEKAKGDGPDDDFA